MTVLAIAGSPSLDSRTQRLLSHVLTRLARHGLHGRLLALTTLPADALIRADTATPAIESALNDVAAANVVLVGTPIYKASFSGLLKTFLDLLPQDGLEGKLVLPIATGGSLAHLLALDYALRPVLQALSCAMVLPSVFALDREIVRQPGSGVALDESLNVRIGNAVSNLTAFAERLSLRPYTAASGMCNETAALLTA